jgi:hypothetical protein
MRRLFALGSITAVIGLAVGLAGCGNDENEPVADKPDLAGFAVANIDTTNIADNGEITLSLAVTDANGGTDYTEDQIRVRVWETPIGGEKALVYDSATLVAGAPSLAATKKPPKKIKCTPINLAMVLDRSGSMNSSEEGHMQDAALRVLDLLDHGDQVEVINVSDNVNIDASFRDHTAPLVETAILHPSVTSGWTKIYDGVLRGVFDSDHSRGAFSRRAVFTVTDGEDNRSESSLDSLIAAAQSERVPVFVIGLADRSDPSDLDEPGLTRLARETGGRFVKAYSSRFFSAILDALSRSLTDEVTFSYESPLGDAPRTTTVEVTVGDEAPTTTDVTITP